MRLLFNLFIVAMDVVSIWSMVVANNVSWLIIVSICCGAMIVITISEFIEDYL
jgi:hypothetical protein